MGRASRRKAAPLHLGEHEIMAPPAFEGAPDLADDPAVERMRRRQNRAHTPP
jgi:hypothetical protein